MSVLEMSKIISQIAHHQTIVQHGITHPPAINEVKRDEFDNLLTESISKINNLHNNVEIASRDYLTGDSDIGINDIMIMQQKSSIALSLGVQTANKFISAYREIMSMNI